MVNIFAKQFEKFMGFMAVDLTVVVGIKLLKLHRKGTRIHFTYLINIACACASP